MVTSSNDLDILSPVPRAVPRATRYSSCSRSRWTWCGTTCQFRQWPLRPVVHLVSQVAMTGEAQLGNVPGSGRYGTPEGKVWQGKKTWKSTWQHSIWLKDKKTRLQCLLASLYSECHKIDMASPFLRQTLVEALCASVARHESRKSERICIVRSSLFSPRTAGLLVQNHSGHWISTSIASVYINTS